MPELPEVETARRQVFEALEGRPLTRVDVVGDTIVFGPGGPERAQKALQKTVITGSGRHGKYMWLETKRGPSVVFHLGMTGSFVPHAKGEKPAFWKLTFAPAKGPHLSFVNKRRLGRVTVVDDVYHEPPVQKLGPDALLQLPKAAVLAAQMGKKKVPIKAMLLDQKFFAGVGNWIADEVLFQSGIAPTRRAETLSLDEVRTLRRVLSRVLKKACAVDADADRFPGKWLFHRRWGKDQTQRSPDGYPLRFDEVGGRTTCWCPDTQH